MINTIANEARIVVASFVFDKRDRLDNVDISVTSKQSGGLKKAGKFVARV